MERHTSRSALKTLSVWTEFERGASFGARYLLISQAVGDLARELGIDRLCDGAKPGEAQCEANGPKRSNGLKNGSEQNGPKGDLL
jgi:hypothetical protein